MTDVALLFLYIGLWAYAVYYDFTHGNGMWLILDIITPII